MHCRVLFPSTTFIESQGSRRCMFIRRGFVHCADVKQAEKRVRSAQRAPIRVRTSMKGDAHAFPVTVDAFVGAYFPPTVRRRRHNDSHFLRAIGTKQHPRVSMDLDRHILMHRHGENPSRSKTLRRLRLGPISESSLYKIADSDECGRGFRSNAARRSDRRRPPVPTKAAGG